MTKPPKPTENSKTKGQHTNATKNFDYTTIADRLRTVSGSIPVIQLVWLNRLTGAKPSRLTATAVLSKGHTFKKFVNNPPYVD